MLLVLAGRSDRAAEALVERWGRRGARLLTCRDLSRAGWRFDPADARRARVCVGGEVVGAREIRGVVTRLPSVTPRELPHIVESDREYVAAEMTAFLTAWLTDAPFTVVNRPTHVCLIGPNWRREQWLHAGLRAGLRVRHTRQLLSLHARRRGPSAGGLQEDEGRPSNHKRVVLTVVGRQCLGTAHPTLKAQARRLAEAAGVELLDVEFSGGGCDAEFVGAYLSPDVSRPQVADSLLAFFDAGRAAYEPVAAGR